MMETQNYWEDNSAHAMQVKYESLDGRSCKDEIYRMGIGAGYCEGNLNFATASEDDEVYTKKKVSRLFAMQRNNRADEEDHLSTEDENKIVERYMNKFIFGSTLSKILVYHYLTLIDISKSNICALPEKFGIFFNLKYLNVSDNSLGTYDNYDWPWLEQTGIKNSLVTLNLSKNSLTRLPIQITKLNSLVTLIISHNKLTYLPQNINNLKKLRILDMSHNDLLYLPATISLVNLFFANILHNPFSYQICSVRDNILKVPSLVELSAKVIIDLRMAYDANVMSYRLIRYLDNPKYCFNCGNSFIDSYIKVIMIWMAFEVATYVVKMTKTLPFEYYYCSLNCYQQQNNRINILLNSYGLNA